MSNRSERKTSEGQRDSRNTLNDLTGKEWVYFLNSVELNEGETRPPCRRATQRPVGGTVGGASGTHH